MASAIDRATPPKSVIELHFVITVTTVCFPAIVKISIDETNQPLCL
jgi:hypothetical protein